jgi:sporulation protein YlmC with PRC-barrel domain
MEGFFMDMNDFLDMEVIDKEGQSIGKVDTVEFNEETGTINKIVIKLDKGIFSRAKETITFDQRKNIKDVILLNVIVDVDK